MSRPMGIAELEREVARAERRVFTAKNPAQAAAAFRRLDGARLALARARRAAA